MEYCADYVRLYFKSGLLNNQNRFNESLLKVWEGMVKDFLKIRRSWSLLKNKLKEMAQNFNRKSKHKIQDSKLQINKAKLGVGKAQ